MAKDIQVNEDGHETRTWPELAIGLYDKLTGRGAEISYEFEGFQVLVPSSAAPDAVHAPWTVNGTIRIHTRDRNQGA